MCEADSFILAAFWRTDQDSRKVFFEINIDTNQARSEVSFKLPDNKIYAHVDDMHL